MGAREEQDANSEENTTIQRRVDDEPVASDTTGCALGTRCLCG